APEVQAGWAVFGNWLTKAPQPGGRRGVVSGLGGCGAIPMARCAMLGIGCRFLRWRMASRKQIDRFLECAPIDMANERDHIAADVAFAAIKHLLFDVNPEPVRSAANRARPGAIGATALQSDPAARDLVLDADRAGIGGQLLGGH